MTADLRVLVTPTPTEPQLKLVADVYRLAKDLEFEAGQALIEAEENLVIAREFYRVAQSQADEAVELLLEVAGTDDQPTQ